VVQIANREGGFAPEVGQPVHVGLAGIGRPGLQRVITRIAGGTMSKSFMINRRTALGGAAAFAAGAGLPAYAQDNKRIVVAPGAATIRGCSPRTSKTPLLAPKGWDVVKDEANAPPVAPR